MSAYAKAHELRPENTDIKVALAAILTDLGTRAKTTGQSVSHCRGHPELVSAQQQAGGSSNGARGWPVGCSQSEIIFTAVSSNVLGHNTLRAVLCIC